MRALILAMLVSLPLAAPASQSGAPSQSGEKPSPRGDEASARAALQARFDAALRADVSALDRVLADDLEYCGVSATCSTKAQYLESVRNGTRKFKSLVPKVERVTMYADSAVLTGKVYALSIGDGTERQVDAYFLVVLAWRDGRWQMTNQSSTLLQPAPK